MASSRDSSAESKKSYDSVEFFESKKFALTDEEKAQCVTTLHCSKARRKLNTYTTWTSHWVKRTKENNVSRFAYTLFKIKRWHLAEENFILDPLKQHNKMCKLTPSNTLWYNFPSTEQCVEDSEMSVDGILSYQLSSEQRDLMKKLDLMMEPLDSLEVLNWMSVQSHSMKWKEIVSGIEVKEAMNITFTEFRIYLTQTLFNYTQSSRLPEREFEEVFINLFQCLSAALGFMSSVKCARSVDNTILQKVTLPIKMKDREDMSLEIKSKPDMFLYNRETEKAGSLRHVFGVVEAKGLHNGAILESDDELDDEDADVPDATQCMQHLSLGPKKKGRKSEPAMPTLDEGDEDDDDDDEEEDDEEDDLEDLENLLRNLPVWLRRISPEMHTVVRKFLPQLIGEMWCCARSQNIIMKTPNGLHVGIGVVGFDIFFVTMKESFRDHERKYEDIVNSASAYSNVFITRPLKLLVKNDRRIMMKILAALLFTTSP